jgi:hypothetical protein
MRRRSEWIRLLADQLAPAILADQSLPGSRADPVEFIRNPVALLATALQ